MQKPILIPSRAAAVGPGSGGDLPFPAVEIVSGASLTACALPIIMRKRLLAERKPMEFKQTVHKRFAARAYDTGYEISDQQLEELFELAGLTPTTFNVQHTRYIVIRDKARMKKLRELAKGQAHVEKCSALIYILGKLDCYRDAPEIYQDVPQEICDILLPAIHEFYDGKEDVQYDEALRNASLAAMTLMLAATDMGLDTCAIIAMDIDKTAEYLGVPEGYATAMMITLGKAHEEQPPRGHRWPVDKIVTRESFDGNPL
ncbi:nitroreductase family protein [Planctomycetota bacterium]